MDKDQMMMVMGIAGFVLQLLIVVGGVTWKLTRMELALTEAISKQRREVDDDLERLRREIGEAMLAIRQKVVEVELYCRDTFMRRDSFYEVTKGINENIAATSIRIETRLDRMETKIDQGRSENASKP